MRRAGQVLLCASALVGGAGAAHWTDDRARTSRELEGAVFPPPMPPPEAMPALTSTAPSATRGIPAPAAPTAPTSPRGPLAAGARPPGERPAGAEASGGAAGLGPFAEPMRDGMVITGATPHRMILFTFDDGPDPRNTPRLLDLLDEYGIRAVFFLTANRISGDTPWQRRNQELAREIVERGHVVGNHTVDHAQLPLLDDAAVLRQVEGADRVFERVLGGRTWLMRPPGGARSARVDRLLAERGYTQFLWNLGSGDFQVREPEEVLRIWRRVLERRERESGDRGGIVLLHDTHEWSVEAVPMIVSWIRQRNCELVDQGEELYDIVADPSLFHVARGGADPSLEAPAASLEPAALERRQRRLRTETRRRCARLASR